MVGLALATSLLQDPNRSDLAVINVLKRLDRSVADAIVWHRVTLTGDMDLVLAIARPSAVVRFDRESETYQRFETGESIGHEFVPVGDRLVMASHDGITVFHNDRAKQYIVDRTTDGRLRVVPAEK